VVIVIYIYCRKDIYQVQISKRLVNLTIRQLPQEYNDVNE